MASVKFAIAVTVLGLVLSVYSLATRQAASTTQGGNASGGASPSLVAGLAQKDGNKSVKSGAAEQPASRRAVDAAGPATLRMGASFLGAFAIGYFLRKFLRWTVLAVGLIVVAVFVLRKSGMINMPWDQIEGQVHAGASWLQAQAGSIKDLLTGYLPSSAAALAGGVMGFWRG